MLFRTVELPSEFTMVASHNVIEETRRKAMRHRSLPTSPSQWLADLRALPNGVPAHVQPPQKAKDEWFLTLHVQSYIVVLYPRRHKDRRTSVPRVDSYNLGAVSPQRIRDHDRLAQGCLLLRPRGWNLVNDPRTIPAGAEAFWTTIEEEYRQLLHDRAIQPSDGPITDDQARYLERIDEMIDAAEGIELAEGNREAYPYARIDAASGQRRGRRGIYTFHVVGGQLPVPGTYVQVAGLPDRGRVRVVDEDDVTVAFDDLVDYDSLPPQGQLVVPANTIVHQREREAVNLLRTAQGRNPGLLAALVDGRVAPLTPSPIEPTDPLDDEQRDAFRKAITVEDLLLIQGPPGTGKTRTITAFTEACAANGERVLITSHTNRAVDNVLERLPASLLAIRVGSDEKVTAEGEPYLLDRQVDVLRQQVTTRVEPALSAYRDLPHVERWAAELTRRNAGLGRAIGEEADLRSRLEDTRRSVGGPAQDRVDALTAERERVAVDAARHAGRAAELAGPRDRMAARSRWLVLGPLFAYRARRVGDQIDEASRAAAASRQRHEDLGREVEAAELGRDREVESDPRVADLLASLGQAAAAVAARCAEVIEAAKALRQSLGLLAELPATTSNLDDRAPGQLREAADDLEHWLNRHLPFLSVRGRLLGEWRDAVTRSTDELHPELIRYANVIAATAIGSASRSELSAIDFDLAIVDEAGQIGVADVIVPLVRASRGVLVGDHMQLPPYLDSEVAQWGAAAGDEAIRDLLAKSAFELLARPGHLPDSNVVRLRTQRRMPPSIADFISTRFYDGWLRSATTEDDPDPLLPRALTIVDTSALPGRRRYESELASGERWGLSGFTNEVEAELLIRLATHYHRRHGGDAWAVIVPYRAQVRAIGTAVGRQIGDATLAGLNVGTVDSFQGGERPVILYGFTRSNRNGSVGFLSELRRANVAFTRAKQRLVLVGDLSTLVNARNEAFADLARALVDHAGAVGEVIGYDALVERLNAMDGIAPGVARGGRGGQR